MQLELKRVILFTDNLESMSNFYHQILGLEPVSSEPGWQEFAAGPCRIALHKGKSEAGTKPPKLVFYAEDVSAARAELITRKVKMGQILSTESFEMCNFKDPDNNPLQISSRK